MDKILVTTDFSSNSKAGLRFAIQLASQREYELTFFHSYYIANLTAMSDRAFAEYEIKEALKIKKELDQFVASVYRDVGVVSINKKCVINSAVFADGNIREYAEENKFSFICISTRGSGKLKKIFGTNTSSLIAHSAVPVVAVPNNYRRSEIKSVIYASDLVNLENELKKVIEFTKPLKAKVEILHFNYPIEITPDKNTVEKLVKKNLKYNIKLHIENINLAESLISNMEDIIKRSKPSMLIMFTQQNRSFFNKMFFNSNSANYSFKAKVPLLVFNKI
jgi:nucleotide-binding universal stress UspA family protein/mannose/fructose/N-acetylgalactosamine-specific phosphotransferase system component IIB